MDENYKWLVKQFLMPILINGMYLGPNDDQEGSSLKAVNEVLTKVDWNFLVYGNDFSHTYKLRPRTFNIECKSFPEYLPQASV